MGKEGRRAERFKAQATVKTGSLVDSQLCVFWFLSEPLFLTCLEMLRTKGKSWHMLVVTMMIPGEE
jgi:hypothetical protein